MMYHVIRDSTCDFVTSSSRSSSQSSTMYTNPLQCLTLTLLILPALVLSVFWFATFPHPPEPLVIHPSLASLPPSCPSSTIYPETFYEGGAYVKLPYGRVCCFSSSFKHQSNVCKRSDIGSSAQKPAKKCVGLHLRSHEYAF